MPLSLHNSIHSSVGVMPLSVHNSMHSSVGVMPLSVHNSIHSSVGVMPLSVHNSIHSSVGVMPLSVHNSIHSSEGVMPLSIHKSIHSSEGVMPLAMPVSVCSSIGIIPLTVPSAVHSSAGVIPGAMTKSMNNSVGIIPVEMPSSTHSSAGVIPGAMTKSMNNSVGIIPVKMPSSTHSSAGVMPVAIPGSTRSPADGIALEDAAQVLVEQLVQQGLSWEAAEAKVLQAVAVLLARGFGGQAEQASQQAVPSLSHQVPVVQRQYLAGGEQPDIVSSDVDDMSSVLSERCVVPAGGTTPQKANGFGSTGLNKKPRLMTGDLHGSLLPKVQAKQADQKLIKEQLKRQVQEQACHLQKQMLLLSSLENMPDDALVMLDETFKSEFQEPQKMIYLPLILLWLELTCAIEFESLKHIKSKTPDNEQTATVRGLVERVAGERADDFILLVNSSLSISDKDTYQLETVGSKLQITGSSGVAVAMGFYFYLKYYCNSLFTWGGQNINLPNPLPAVTGKITTTAQDRFRYYQNVCTVSYSFAFWDWGRWERHLDWMALSGINLPLAFTGQEAMFQRLYINMGISNQDLEGFFGGPAFLAWSRMGNIQGWGGPLPQMWITNQLLLQHRILQRMRGFGMTPVLPAFAGHVPSSFTKVFPQANVTRLGGWGGFNATYSYTYLLDFSDPLFEVIGAKFIQLMISEYGVDHVYNADTFNEMTPASCSTSYLASAGKAVYNAMVQGDPDAIWLMQGWLFMDSSFWKSPQIKALVNSVPQGRMIILDLFAELSPIYQRTESFYGQPFIWCMLHNFGGTMELYGALDNINTGPSLGRKFANSTMVGIGLTPEGIFQNEVIYEFMNENAWREGPRDIDVWMTSYIQQRYNYTNAAIIKGWQLLKKSVYNCTDSHGDGDRVLVTERPQLNYDVSAHVWYDPEALFAAWDSLLQASADFDPNELFLYDLVDITRNSLQLLSLSYYSSLVQAYNASNIPGVVEFGKRMVEILQDMDLLLASDKHFLLGRWLADAASWGTDMAEKILMLYNARNQITLWGPNGEIVDYASKQWSGLFKDYYAPRWMFFTNWLVELIENGTKFDGYIFEKNIMHAVETPFTLDLNMYTTNTTGNTLSIARELHDKYRPETRKEYFQLLSKSAPLQGNPRRKLESVRKWYQKGMVVMQLDEKNRQPGELV